jgi:uridylate kinase
MAKKKEKLVDQAASSALIMDKDLPAYIAKMKAEGRKLAFINGDGTTTPID